MLRVYGSKVLVRRKISISDGKKLRMFEPSDNNRDWIRLNYNGGFQTPSQSENSPSSRENILTNQSPECWQSQTECCDGQDVLMEQLLICQLQSELVSPRRATNITTQRDLLISCNGISYQLPT